MTIPFSRRLAGVLIFPLVLYAGSVSAGPVQAGEAGGQTADAEGAPTALPALAGPQLGEGVAPSPAAKHATATAATGADPGSSASTLAAEIIKETEAAGHASDPQRKATAQTDGQAAASAPSTRNRAAEDDWGVREIGKAAIQWVKASVPWLRSEADDGAAGNAVSLDPADPLAPPLDGGLAGPGAKVSAAQLPGASRGQALDPTSTVGYGRSAPPTIPDPGQNVLRMVVDVIREVLAHPMTWLVVSLFVIGGFAVKKIDRRPTK